MSPPRAVAHASGVGSAAADSTDARRGPVDSGLLAYAASTRRFLRLSVGIGVASAILAIAQAWLLAAIIAGCFMRHQSPAALRPQFVALISVVCARAALAWATERAAHRSSASAKSELRVRLVRKIAAIGPTGVGAQRSGAIASLATGGINALDAYFARYLPQLILAVIVPIAVVAAIGRFDWLSAVIIVVTVPLIPLFMALVGQSTAERTRSRAAVLERLAGHFVDVVAGLPTLRIFRRARLQAAAIRTVTDQYRTTTMTTLRLAFVSSLVLELLATVSVALVAVVVGLRLLSGHLELQTAFFVLVLAPEAYLPLRRLGESYHASADGVAAAGAIFDILGRPDPVTGSRIDVPDPVVSAVTVRDVEVTYPDRRLPALREVSMQVEPGELLAVTGPSGCGKSTLLGVLLGLVPVTRGSVSVGGVAISDLSPAAWHAKVAWVPQRPHLFAGSLSDNIRLGSPAASDADVAAAASAAGLDDVVARAALGLGTQVGADGVGISVGERQRIAIARAFLRDAPLLLLDEPTANLDGETERAVVDSMLRLVEGRTVVLVAHRPTLVALADRVVELAPSLVAS